MVAQLDILETMTPLEFLTFRERLDAASGFQSDQFRQIEFVLGMKSERAIAALRRRQPRARRAGTALSSDDAWDAFLRYLARERYPVPAEPARARCCRCGGASPEVQAILVDVYRAIRRTRNCASGWSTSTKGSRSGAIATSRWSNGTIGQKTGTGGSAGAAYLRETVGRPLFPDLWAIDRSCDSSCPPRAGLTAVRLPTAAKGFGGSAVASREGAKADTTWI
jgi:tryptophan 2,3-dioxygenase